MIVHNDNPYWWGSDDNPATQANDYTPDIEVTEVELWDDFAIQFHYKRNGDKCRLLQRFDNLLTFTYGIANVIETQVKSYTDVSMTILVTEEGPNNTIHNTVHIIPYSKFTNLWK